MSLFGSGGAASSQAGAPVSFTNQLEGKAKAGPFNISIPQMAGVIYLAQIRNDYNGFLKTVFPKYVP